MAKKLDNHFKCPKSLKTMFAGERRIGAGELKKIMVDAQNVSDHSEYSVDIRGPKDESKKKRQ